MICCFLNNAQHSAKSLLFSAIVRRKSRFSRRILSQRQHESVVRIQNDFHNCSNCNAILFVETRGKSLGKATSHWLAKACRQHQDLGVRGQFCQRVQDSPAGFCCCSHLGLRGGTLLEATQLWCWSLEFLFVYCPESTKAVWWEVLKTSSCNRNRLSYNMQCFLFPNRFW